MDVSREGLDGHVSQRESGCVVALWGGVSGVQPNVGLKRTGVNTHLVSRTYLINLEKPMPDINTVDLDLEISGEGGVCHAVTDRATGQKTGDFKCDAWAKVVALVGVWNSTNEVHVVDVLGKTTRLRNGLPTEVELPVGTRGMTVAGMGRSSLCYSFRS